MANKKILLPENIDWALLKKQSMDIVDLRATGKFTPKIAESLTGIIHFLDSIRDNAAEVLGEEAVFGKLGEDSEEKEEETILNPIAERVGMTQLSDAGKTWRICAEDTFEGLEYLKQLRRKDCFWRGCRIKTITETEPRPIRKIYLVKDWSK